MIVPMKKVSLIVLEDKKTAALKMLEKLGLLHIEINEGHGGRLPELRDNIALLEKALYIIGKPQKEQKKQVPISEVFEAANGIILSSENKSNAEREKDFLITELERMKKLGEFDPLSMAELTNSGVHLSLYEMPRSEYRKLDESITTVCLSSSKKSVLFVTVEQQSSDTSKNKDTASSLLPYRVEIPNVSPESTRNRISELDALINDADKALQAYCAYADSIKQALSSQEHEVEFETYATGMAKEALSSQEGSDIAVVYLTGYIEAENLEKLKEAAKENFWGLLAQDPTPDDNVPTKLKNNRLVSLIYPITDFLGTVPGYFEYDISGWFLSFILIFFGIIFGDGGYGLFICAVAAIPIVLSLAKRKSVAPAFLLMGLFGLSTVLWGTLTCTWFGLPANKLPVWLQRLSIPVISNVYEDKLWQPFWTSGDVGLTTAQNVQILCFTLALVQLSVAHIMGAVRNRRSAKLLGDIGSLLQLIGIYYLVLSLVVNSAVFTFGLRLGGIPVGTVSIALIGVGFLLSFVFSNYEGSILKSVLSSLTNIVSVLLGVVNVFSDIVSYIRLWAVGLAGAAISATVNELVSPLLGNFMFMIFALVLLIFGHGLNMILNVLSVIVHGIRLNTLEFSSHLDMSWSGHKFKPFKEQN